MAQLPPDGEWLIQQIGDEVVLYQRYTEKEIVRFHPAHQEEIERALVAIHAAGQLTEAARAWACFWCGYFYAHAVSFERSST